MTCVRKLSYCFTLNNYTEYEKECLLELSKNKRVRYMVVGEEIGENGTPHLQGYVYFHTLMAFAKLKKMIPRAHLEVAMGTPEQAAQYCKKDGKFQEIGDLPMTRKRQGDKGKEYWDTQLGFAKKGRVDLCDSKLQITHFNSLNAIAAKYLPMPPHNDKIENYWYFGPTGTGKSLKARSDYPDAYLKMCNKWWDGYNGEEVVIIEDFDKKHSVLGHHLKIWGDRYSFPAEVKGSKTNLRPKTIIVTSNWTPDEIWKDEPQTRDPIIRRYELVEFTRTINQVLM